MNTTKAMKFFCYRSMYFGFHELNQDQKLINYDKNLHFINIFDAVFLSVR